MASESKKMDKKPTKGPTPEEILQNFHKLRIEQRGIATKLTELELDLNEHKMVIETLKNVSDDRKCFRLIGGILTERKVKDVLPILITNKEKLTEIIEKLNENLALKGSELNEYKEKHNIRIRDQMDLKPVDKPKEVEAGPQNVLVS